MSAKKTEARFCAVLPILNDGCSIPSTVPLPLSDLIALRKIRGDDLAIITEHDDDAIGHLTGRSFTLTIESFDENMPLFSIQKIISAALFSINVLGNGTPLSIEKAYVIRTLRKNSVEKVHRVPGHRHSNLNKFEIAKGTELSYATQLFSAVCTALEKHSPLRLTLSRYNSAIGRGSSDDKIIDLCIALESIFQAQTEISFQFALYNSILSESDTQKRLAIFKNLKTLYSERSKLVHGIKELNEDWYSKNWTDLLLIAKAAILQKIDFLVENDHSEWKPHLEKLALGSQDD